MRKILKLLGVLCATAIVCSCAGVVGCKQAGEKHNFSEAFSYNETEHWHACTDEGCEEVSDSAAHTFGDGTITKEATFEAAGEKTFTCTVCDYQKTEPVAKKEHNYSAEWKHSETEHWRECTDEGYETLTADKAAHTFDEGEITKEPTFDEDGEKTFTCTVCDYQKTEIVAKKEHHYSAEWKHNETEHWHECTDEGCTEVSEKTAHTFDNGVITKEPTFEEAGEKTFTCTICGYQKTEIVEKKEHHYSAEWKHNETEHWHACTDEGCEEVSDSAAHTFDNGEITKEPTFEEAGVKTFTCTVCGYQKTETVAKKEHSYSTEWKHNETEHWHECTDEGYEKLTADNAAHVFGEWTVTKRPTLEENGEKTRACTECGYSESGVATMEDILENYVTVQNADIGAKASTDNIDGLSYNTSNATTSAVYKVKVTASGDFGIRIRETAAWQNGYLFIFAPALGKIQYPAEGGQAWSAENLFASGDVLEVGAIDITDSETVYIIVKVNGETKIEAIAPKAESGTKITAWSATFEQVVDLEYEAAVTVTNRELGKDGDFSTNDMADNYAYLAYETENATNSVVYKFKYTHGVTTYVGLRNAEGGWAGYMIIFVGGNIQYGTDTAALQTKGGVLTEGTTYDVEIGAIDVKNSDKVYVYIKLNGVETAAGYFTRLETEGAGISVWGAGGSGTFGQAD